MRSGKQTPRGIRQDIFALHLEYWVMSEKLRADLSFHSGPYGPLNPPSHERTKQPYRHSHKLRRRVRQLFFES